MLTFLILVSLTGFLMSKYRKLGAFNPFTLFFGVWSAIFIAYSFFQDLYYPVSSEYLLIQICVQLGALFVMLFARPPAYLPNAAYRPVYQVNKLMFFIVQLILLAGVPMMYLKAVELAGGSVFTSAGYTRLRYAFNMEGASVGILRYFTPLSFVASAVAVYFATKKQISKFSAMLTVFAGLCYAFLATGRTFFLLIFILIVIPLAVSGKIKAKTLAVLGALLVGVFFLIAWLTSKGTSVNASFSENVAGFVDSMQSYLVAPFVALSMLFDKLNTMHYGDYSLRFVLSLLSSQGLTDPPAPIVKGYQFTPIPTNLYTVYEVYFRDFGVFGFFIPLVFLPIHWIFYKQAKRNNDFFIILYAISVYPLLTQILQDQYMTLISTWIQMALACIVLIKKHNIRP